MELINRYQRDFPLSAAPFADIGRIQGLTDQQVMQAYRDALDSGAVSRLGGVFHQSAGGASTLAAMAVPPDRLHAVAAQVSAEPGVNHNYEREHHFNLWFVLTAQNQLRLQQTLNRLELATGLPIMVLPMVRPYRIDLAFDLNGSTASHTQGGSKAPVRVIREDEVPLAALVEEGLTICPRPFDVWAQEIGWPVEQVLSSLQEWLDTGLLRRFGTVVRHHEFGFDANAMTVFEVPAAQVDSFGLALAQQPEVTLSYQRVTAKSWSYNLYCMVHGRDRATVCNTITDLIQRCGLQAYPHAVLFSLQRFKQQGAMRFRTATPQTTDAGVDHVLA
ncbi:MAG: Lrp/AsnC family transcriptional regulator [Burkholderiaceae bacterium]|nr:Lrp/AsnC family transcriptional regulator [Burkholderiaceae bacterium]